MPEQIIKENPLRLSNDAKIRACNFWNAMDLHKRSCDICYSYLYSGFGDLCFDGKRIIVEHLAFTDTTPVLNENQTP